MKRFALLLTAFCCWGAKAHAQGCYGGQYGGQGSVYSIPIEIQLQVRQVQAPVERVVPAPAQPPATQPPATMVVPAPQAYAQVCEPGTFCVPFGARAMVPAGGYSFAYDQGFGYRGLSSRVAFDGGFGGGFGLRSYGGLSARSLGGMGVCGTIVDRNGNEFSACGPGGLMIRRGLGGNIRSIRLR